MKILKINPLKNQKGVAMLATALVVTVFIGGVIVATSQYFDNTMRRISAQRDRIAGLQVLQDFALQAQKANDNWIRAGNACPGGTARPAGFCWLAGSTYCVRHPIGNWNICIDPAWVQLTSPDMRASVAAIEALPEQNLWDGIKDYVADVAHYSPRIIAEVQKDILNAVSGQAHAVRPRPYLPDDVVPASATIPVMDYCPLGGPNICKQCGANALAGEIRCLEIRVCLRRYGCRNMTPNTPTAGDWFRQSIGIAPRGV